MSIELAPHNKQGLALLSPVIAGSGAVGLGDAWPPDLTPQMCGAIVTAAMSLSARKGKAQPLLVETPGGYLLATGDQNPGYRRVIQTYAAAWRRLGVPVLASLSAQDGADWPVLAARREEDAAAAGIELALPSELSAHAVALLIGAVRRATTLPLVARLPVTRAAELAQVCVQAGADSLVLGTPPLGAYPAAGVPVEAPIAGPAALPFTLHALAAVAAQQVGVPLVACGGICSLEGARLCLDWGASAVQVRSLLWTDPAAAGRLAAALRSMPDGHSVVAAGGHLPDGDEELEFEEGF